MGVNHNLQFDMLGIRLAEQSNQIKLMLKIVEITVKNHKDTAKLKKVGLQCTDCGKSYDYWQAICPRCMKAEKARYDEIDLRNKHLESVVKSILGDMEL